MSSTTRESFGVRRSRLVLPALLFLAPALTLAAPRLTPLMLILVSAGLLFEGAHAGLTSRSILRATPAFALCLLFAGYVAVNAGWALDRGAAFSKAGWLLLLVFASFAAINALSRLAPERVDALARAHLAGVAVGTGVVLIELVTDQAMLRFLLNAFGLPPPTFKDVTIEGGKVLSIARYELNPNVALATLYLWPALLILARGRSRYRMLWIAALAAATACAAGVSEHQTSQIALVVAGIVLVASFAAPCVVNRGLAALWVLGFVLVVPAVTFAYQAGWHQATWLPKTAKARIILWNTTAERLESAPVLGIGVRSTRMLDQADARPEEGFNYARRTGRHAHNFYLQAWYELGAIGACLAALAGAAVILAAGRMPAEAIPFGNALFATFAVLAAFAWDIWQTWLMAALGLAAASFSVAARAVAGGRDEAATGPRAD